MQTLTSNSFNWRIPLLALAMLGIFLPLSAQTTYTVDNTSADVATVNSLPWAINEANTDAVASTINVTATGTVSLINTLFISEPVTINGTLAAGEPTFTISRGGGILQTTGTNTGLTITNLGFYGTTANDFNNRAINTNNWSDVEISNCKFESVRRTAIEVANGSNVTITDNSFLTCGGVGGGYIVALSTLTTNGTNRLAFSGNTFSGGTNAVSLTGMDGITVANTGLPEVLLLNTDGRKTVGGTNLNLDNCANVSIVGFDLGYDNGASGISGTGLNATDCANLLVNNLTIDRRSEGIKVKNSATVSVTNNMLTNNNIRCIRVENGSNATVTGNTFTTSGGVGGGYILELVSIVADGGSRLAVSGNIFSGGNNAVSLTGMDGITVAKTGSPEVLLLDNDGRKTVAATNLNLVNCANVSLVGFDLGYDNGASGISGTGLNATDCANLTVNNLTIDRRSEGIKVKNSATVSVTNNMLMNNNARCIRVENGSNATVTGNTFTTSGGVGGGYILELVNIVADGGSRLAVSGNTFSGGNNAVCLSGIDGVTVAKTGSPEVLLLDNDGRKTVAATNLNLVNCANVSLVDFDLGYNNGASGISGTGLNTTNCANLTVNNLTIDRRSEGIKVKNSATVSVTNNTLTNNNVRCISVGDGSNATVTGNTFTNSGGAGGGYILGLDNIADVGGSRLSVSGNTFSGGNNALYVSRMDGVTIAESGSPEILVPANDGKQTVAGTALNLNDCDNVSLGNLTLSYTAGPQTGTGMIATTCANLSLSAFTIVDRTLGIHVSNSATVSVTNNSISNANLSAIRVENGSNATVIANTITASGGAGNRYALELLSITADGGPRLSVSGNTFAGGTNAVWLNNMDGVTVAKAAPAEVVLADNDGRTSVAGTSLKIQNSDNVTLDDLDFSYVGASPTGTGLNGVTCVNLSVSNATISDRLTGISIENCLSPSVVTNTLTNNTTRGIFIKNGENATVTGNALTNCGAGYGNGALHFESIAADAGGARLQASGNSFTDCNSGVYASGMPDLIVSDGSVAGTEVTITEADQVGPFATVAVDLYLAVNYRVEGLTLKAPAAPGGQGIRAVACSGLVVTGNSIAGRNIGVYLDDPAHPSLTLITNSQTVSGNLLEGNDIGLQALLNLTAAPLTATGNNIVCNTTGIQALRGAMIDASGNYWGDAGGSATDSGNGDTYLNQTNGTNNALVNNTTTFSATPVTGVATLTVAQIAASGNAAAITDGQTATSTVDHTDFGNVFTGATLTRTFTISNAGTDALTISDITVAGDAAFTIGAGAPTTVAGGSTATFDVVYAPTATGTATATTVTVAHGACQDDDGEFSFAVSGEAVINPALPVALTTFTGRPNGKNVLLEWTTETEAGNAAFEIQRRARNDNFLTIGEVAGAGDSSTPLNYSFTDLTAADGTNYYRLKQVDVSGDFIFSPIISVLTDGGAEDGVLLFPNPTSGAVNLVMKGDWGTSTVSMIDAAGRTVREWSGLPANTRTSLSLENLVPGVYQVRIADEKKVITRRVVKR